MAPDGSTFYTHRKERTYFCPYLGQYQNTPSLPNNPNTVSYQVNLSNSPEDDSGTPFNFMNPHTSINTIEQHQANSHPRSTYQNLPNSSSLNENLDNFDSADSNSEMLPFIIPPPPTHPLFLNYNHASLTLSIPLLYSRPILKPYQLIFEFLFHIVTYALFHRKLTVIQNPK